MSHCRCFLAVFGLLTVVAAGCGPSAPKLYPASGTVTYEEKPLANATVIFIPQSGRPSMATTDASGKYTISTNGKPGAPLGTYNVTVSWKEGSADAAAPATEMPTDNTEVSSEQMLEIQDNMSKMAMKMRDRDSKESNQAGIPAKYSIPEGSGLTAKVTEDATKNVFDFPLTP